MFPRLELPYTLTDANPIPYTSRCMEAAEETLPTVFTSAALLAAQF